MIVTVYDLVILDKIVAQSGFCKMQPQNNRRGMLCMLILVYKHR